MSGAVEYLFNELLHQHDGTAEGRRLARQRSGYEEFTYSDGTVCNRSGDPSCHVPRQDRSNEYSYDRSQCVTAECAAGLRPAPSENRTQSQIDYGLCKLVCNIAGMPLTITGNAIAGGGSVGTVLGFIGKKTVCGELVCTKP